MPKIKMFDWKGAKLGGEPYRGSIYLDRSSRGGDCTWVPGGKGIHRERLPRWVAEVCFKGVRYRKRSSDYTTVKTWLDAQCEAFNEERDHFKAARQESKKEAGRDD